MSVTADYKVYIDWNNDGDFGEAYEDISIDVKSIQFDRGFKGPPPEYANAGRATIVLKNGTGKYTSENVNSPINIAYSESDGVSPMTIGIAVRITMAIDSGAEFIQWQGLLDTIDPVINPGETKEAGIATVSAYGVLEQFSDGETSVSLQIDKTTGENLETFLTSDGFPVIDREIDIGQSTLSKWWVKKGTSRSEVFKGLQDAELGRIGETKDGKIFFHDRHHLFAASDLTPRATYGIGGLKMWNAALVNPIQSLFNIANGEVKTFNMSNEQVLIVYTDAENGLGGEPIKLEVGETKTVTLTLDDTQFLCVLSWADPSITYYAYTSPDGSLGSDSVEVTADIVNPNPPVEYAQKIEVTFTNNSLDIAYITTLTASGTALVEDTPISVKSPSSGASISITRYKKREFLSPSDWMTDLDDAQAMLDYVVALCEKPRTQISFQILANVNDDLLLEAQTIDIDDRIHIDDNGGEFGLYTDADYIVDYISNEITPDIPNGFHKVNILCHKAPTIELGAQASPRDPRLIPDDTIPGVDTGIPDGIELVGMDPSNFILAGVRAKKNNASLYECEFRAQFVAVTDAAPPYIDMATVSEGGTFADNGTTKLIFTGLYASYAGGTVQFLSSEVGRWYIVGRLRNSFGWSNWSDGNLIPERVRDYVSTEGGIGSDIGPPDNSNVTILTGATLGSVIVKATRPTINGNCLLFADFQVKVATGAWRDLDANAGAAVTKYDGAGVNHTYDKAAGTITKVTVGWGTAAVGDLILLDVTDDGAFQLDRCIWFTVDQLSSTQIIGVGVSLFVLPDVGTNVWNKLRLRIVKPPWEWSTEGYLGATPGKGWTYLQFFNGGQQGDRTTQVFYSPPIQLPTGTTAANIVARAYFQNKISRSECGRGTKSATTTVVDDGNPSGAHDLQILTKIDDPSIPDGMMVLQWYRDTVNYTNIVAMGFWFSTMLPANGPYLVEREAFPARTIEEGQLEVVLGDPNMIITRNSDTAVLGNVLCIFLDDSGFDLDATLAADLIKTQGQNALEVYTGFSIKDGVYSYAIVKPWWPNDLGTDNFKYVQLAVPDEIGGNISAEVWRSASMPIPTGDFYVTGCSNNGIGVGTRMTASSQTVVTITLDYWIPIYPRPDRGTLTM